MGIVASPLSTFCQTLEEPLDHQFIRCPISIAFWISVVEIPTMHVTDVLLICSHGVVVYLTEVSIFFADTSSHGYSLTQLWFKMNAT